MSTPPPASDRLDPKRAGMSAIAAYLLWGFIPIFYKFLDFADAAEIVLHRVIWSAPFLFVLLYLARRSRATFAVLADRKTLLVLLFTALVIGANWWVFIYAINTDRVLEVSLGYFINPLMNVAVGMLVASERFNRLRALAIGLAALGVINQIFAVGELPILALFLALSFTVYGYVRKTIQIDARIGLFWETVVIGLPSLIVVTVIEMTSSNGHFTDGPYEMIMLILAGPVTVIPLLFFLMGARGLTFATIGILQFIAPSIQFGVGLAYGEPFSLAHLFTFILIWLGLAVFVFELLNFERQRQRAPA